MDSGAPVTYALLGLWVGVGILAYILYRDRRRRKKREAEIEQQLALWVDGERRRGRLASAIAEELEEKRREIAREK